MHSFLEFSGYNDDSSLVLSTEVYEDLTKKSSDRYEIIIPIILNYSKDLKKIFDIWWIVKFSIRLFQNNMIQTSMIKY